MIQNRNPDHVFVIQEMLKPMLDGIDIICRRPRRAIRIAIIAVMLRPTKFFRKIGFSFPPVSEVGSLIKN
jgi:hypothetical protein